MTRPEITDTSGEGTVCSVDGAVVHVKRREAREDVPAFEYVIGTDEGGPVAVRLRQPLPADVDPAAVGFPPACETDWRLDDSTLVFEAPVEPGEPVRTAWGVDGDDHPPIEPPDIDVVPFDRPDSAEAGEGSPSDQPAGTEAAAADDASPAAGSPADDGDTGTFDLSDPPEGLGTDAGDLASVPSDAGESAQGAGDVAAPDDIDAPEVGSPVGGGEGDPSVQQGEAVGNGPGAGSGGSTLDDGATPSGSGEGDPLVAQLVAELESGDLDDDHRRALQDALAVRLSDSTNAFVEHLQEKLERRAERLSDEIESLEESVERVYGVKADSSELDAVKRGITELDDAKVGQAELEELRAVAEDLRERASSTAEAQASLRDRHEELAADAASESDLAALEARAAEAERLAELADTVATLREDLDALEETAATESTVARLADRIDELGRRHEELSEAAASSDDVDQLRDAQRARLNETRTDLAAVRETLETEYSADAEISAELDRRLQRSLGTLVLFGIGSTGLLSTLPLALTGTPGAAVTFVGGALALSAWWYLLGSAGDATGPSVSSQGEPVE